MGQRLNIEIVNGETSLANCYYHWSAYTGSALNLTKHIIDSYYDSEAIVGLKMAIELLEATGGGVNETERAEIQKQPEKFGSFEFKDCTNRNNGLISVTENGKEETRKWEEGRVTIDLGSETFKFDVAWFDMPEEYFEEYCDEEDLQFEDLAICKYDLDAVPFADVEDLIEFIDSHPSGVRTNDNGEDMVIHWIC